MYIFKVLNFAPKVVNFFLISKQILQIFYKIFLSLSYTALSFKIK